MGDEVIEWLRPVHVLSPPLPHLIFVLHPPFFTSGIVAIHFATPAEECIRRIAQRVGHPTLPPERGPKAVASFAKALEPPTLAEGFEKVHVVRSYEEANALMLSYGATPPPLPPPVPLAAAARPGGKYGAREWDEVDDDIAEEAG